MASVEGEGLRTYLYSTEPLQDRLRVGERAFLAPLNVLVAQKEDVVIVWLSELLIDKALTLSTEDLGAAWKTMNTLLCSRRLKAFCSNDWLCPLSSSFTETLVDIINSSSEDIIREGAVEICRTLISNPVLAPLVIHSHDHCLFLTKGLINWLVEGHKSDLDVTLTMTMTLKVGTHLLSQPDRIHAMFSVVDHLLIPSARLNATFQDDDREVVKKLLKEVKFVVSRNLFQKSLGNLYCKTLCTLFDEETKAVLSTDAENLLMSILSAIENETVETTQFLIAEFFTEFSVGFKDQGVAHFQMLIVLSHMLGLSLPDSKIPSINKNCLAAQKLKPSKLDKGKQEALLCSMLFVVESASLDLGAKVSSVSLKYWLQSLCEMLVKTVPVTTHGYKCLQILLVILPKDVSNFIWKNFLSIHCLKNAPNPASNIDALYSAYDDLLCEALEVCIKLRNMPKLFGKVSFCLKENSASLEKLQLIPESLLVYDGKLIFPPRFMLSVTRAIGTLGHKQVLPVWKTMLYYFTKDCVTLLKAPGKSGDLQFVSVVVWLLSCIMKASPTIQAVSVVGDAQNFACIMNQIAVYGIKPLVTAMLTHPHDNNVCGSILAMCHTWGEVHTNLLSTDSGYSQHSELPKVYPPKPSSPSDFSYLLPFISPEEWAQISARVANFGNQLTQLALVQLVVQKLSQGALEHHRNSLFLDITCDQPSQTPTMQTIEAQSKYLINALDTWGSNVSQLMTVHLVYILPFIQDSHLPAIARHLVCGIREGKKPWHEYVESHQFYEAGRLHPHIFSSICSALITVSESCKRKISESDDTQFVNKNYCMKMLKKMSKISPLLLEFDTRKEEENALWDMLKECGNIMRKLAESSNASTRSIGNTMDFSALIHLIGRFPLAYLNRGFQTAILLVLFTLLIQEDLEGREENFSSLIRIINQIVCSECRVRLFSVTDANCLLQWLIQKRLSFPFSVVMQHMTNLSQIVLKKQANTNPSELSYDKHDTPESQSFDQLLSALFYKLIDAKGNAGYIRNLVEYLTTSPGADTDPELFIQPAVFLMAALYKVEKFTCKWAMRRLSTWVLRQLKKMDLATTAPSTAAAILTAHTIIVIIKTLPTTLKKKSKNNSQIVDNITYEDNEIITEVSEEHRKEEDFVLKNQTNKTHKWQKLIGRSFQLAELCLSSGHHELEEYALTFLLTVSEHSNSLQSYLPSHTLTNVWSALSHPDCLPKGSDTLLHSKISLKSLFLTASPDDYEKLLQDLIKRTLSGSVDLTHTLVLWQLVIDAKVIKAKGSLKCRALEHLIPILVRLIAIHNKSEECDSPYLIPLLETLKKVIKSELDFKAQSRASGLTPCTTIHLQTLPVDQFNQAFTASVDIVNYLVVCHIGLVENCMPSVLAAISHLATSLISQASQDCKLEEDQIKIMMGCGSNLERVVRELAPYHIKLKKVVHFTIATIVGALQMTTVYPAVKTILESIVYQLLDLCDSFCFNHLLVALPPATITFLKHLYSNYSTFHRFSTSKI